MRRGRQRSALTTTAAAVVVAVAVACATAPVALVWCHTVAHVVVLVQENRSFDHLVGYLNTLNPAIDGPNARMCNPYNVSNPAQGQACHTPTAEFVDPDPGHGLVATTEQVFGGTTPADQEQNPPPMNGFVQQNEVLSPGLGERVMRGFTPENVPAAAALVREFAIFDRWFSGMPGPTQPNRFFVHSATAHGLTSNKVELLVRGFPQKTIFESIDESGLTWKSYFQEVPATLFFKYMRRPPSLSKIQHYSQFKADCAAGTLPTYSFIDPRYFDTPNYAQNDDHPSADVSEGQLLFKDVYETLRASPAWENTVLIITYDEHGGFFDHVPTPITGVPNPDGIIGEDPDFDFERLGVRVPTIVVSPWVSRGLVVNRAIGPTSTSEYEHSSVSATVKQLFGLRDFLTRRDAWAGSFDHIFNLTSPRTDCPTVCIVKEIMRWLTTTPAKTIPGPSKSLRHVPPDLDRPLTELQQEFVTLASALTEPDSAKVETGARLTVGQATKFIRQQVNTFFGRQMYPPEEMDYYNRL